MSLEVVVGCMFSGKSEELVRRLRRAQIAGKRVKAFKPKLDRRYADDDLASHEGLRFAAKAVESLSMADLTECDVVGVDEVQFFDVDIVNVLEQAANSGLQVVVAGLDLDWRGIPWEVTKELLARGDKALKLHAVCTSTIKGPFCGLPASRSFLEQPSEERVQIGASESYRACCRDCWVLEMKR